MDVNPLTLGIETAGGVMVRMVPPGAGTTYRFQTDHFTDTTNSSKHSYPNGQYHIAYLCSTLS